jgi:hypothetical protein
MAYEQNLRTIDIERRGYGRRYTWLPVDQLSRTAFIIDCTGTYTRPEMYDIQPQDIVRWREGEQYVQGRITDVVRTIDRLEAQIDDAQPMAPDSYYS